MKPQDWGPPIGDYGFLSDCNSSALVSRQGSIDWLCMPRFDAPALCARILDPYAGHWTLQPIHGARSRRRYVDHSLIHEVVFETEQGAVMLRDALVVTETQDGHALGKNSPHVLARSVTGLEGSVRMRSVFEPRPEYGFVHPLFEEETGGIIAHGGGAFMALSSGSDHKASESRAVAEFEIEEGDQRLFALHHSPSTAPDTRLLSQTEIRGLMDRTLEQWVRWTRQHESYDGLWKDLVNQSARVLQGLIYQPTGAMVAAPTCSLPETIGGVRNWDYRYSWIRDTAYTFDSLDIAVCLEESDRFFDFLVDAALTRMLRDDDLQIMFGIGGEHDLIETELPHLHGWRGSRPVRVGNEAWRQRQLDVYGELLDAACRLSAHLGELDQTTRDFLVRVADAASRRWRERDRGIWEIRDRPRHYVHSKMMCWVALDRAIRLAGTLQAEDRLPAWEEQRDEVRASILANGWNEAAGHFTQAYENDELDASNLRMSIVGFLPPDDPRVQATIRASMERLTDHRGLVYRYRNPDGLEGEEGAFLICTFWLAEALARAGDVARAKEVFENAIQYTNELGLLSEQVDRALGEAIGNYPQALSHIGLIHAAITIDEAERNGGRPLERPPEARPGR